MDKNNISPTGIFSYIYVVRMLAAVMIIATKENVFFDSDLLLRPFLMMLFLLIVSMPILIYTKRFASIGIIEAAGNINPLYGKVIAFLYIFIYLYIAIRAVARFDLYSNSVMFPETDMTFFIAILIIACAYNSLTGLRTLGRTSGILAVLFVVVSIVILSVAAKEINFINLTPFFLDGAGSFVKESLAAASHTFDICLIPLLRGRIKGDIKKHFYIWSAFVFVFIFLLGAIVVSTLGNFANTQMFPSFSISSIGNIGVFKRLDALETANWTFGIVLRLSFIIFTCTDTFTAIYPKSNKRIVTAVVAAIIFAFTTFVSQKINRFTILTEQYNLIVIYIIMVVLLPSAVIIGNKKLERSKKSEKTTAV